MKNSRLLAAFPILALLLFVISCTVIPASNSTSMQVHVVAIESYLAEITRQVAGNRVVVDSLVPVGADPHSFEPAPLDIQKIVQSKMLIINGAGLESWLNPILASAGANAFTLTASNGLTPRMLQPGEDPSLLQGNAIDPHFWMNPLNVITYVNNIRDGLIQIDPAGKDAYTSNAATYVTQLQNLDSWIIQQIAMIPEANRLLVTNHETFGYFADHYGFKIVGTVIPSFSSDASPSAKELAALEEKIKATGVKAIFLEVGANPQLAQQIAQDTGIKVDLTLYTHSLSNSSGPAPTYIEMMKYDVSVIVDLLK